MVNLKLIKCAFNKHSYGKEINEEPLNRRVRICIYCSHVLVTVKDIHAQKQRWLENSIISEVKDGKIFHARQNLNDLIKFHGYDKN
jgi:hypothetical protein